MKPIKTEEDYEIALEKAYNLMQMDLKSDSTESDELEIISVLIEDFEKKHYIIDAPDPIEAIKFRMEQMNMSRKELAEVLGYKSRVSEILSKKRKLTLDMIRKLNERLNIPINVLTKAY